MKRLFVLLVPLSWNIWAASPVETAPCPKNPLNDFKFVKSEYDIDHYVNNKNGSLKLTIRCFEEGTKMDDISGALKKDIDLKALAKGVMTFDSNSGNTLSRTYLVPGEPVMQFSFITDNKNKKSLDATQGLVENFMAKLPVK